MKSTAEHEATLRRAILCRTWLHEQHWPDPLYADSGNGAHLLYRLDFPNDAASTTLVARVLQALALRFNDTCVTVDEATFNAARLLEVPGTCAVVTRESLTALAALVPAPPT